MADRKARFIVEVIVRDDDPLPSQWQVLQAVIGIPHKSIGVYGADHPHVAAATSAGGTQ